MKKFLTAVLIVVVVLVAGYFVAAGVIEMRAKSVAARLKATGHAMSMDDIAPWFEAGSDSAARLFDSVAALLSKDDLRLLASFDSLGWKTDPAGMNAYLSSKTEPFRLLMQASRLGPARFGLDYRAGMNCRIPKILPSFGTFRKLLSVEARALAAAGSYDSALAVLGASLRLANALAEPLLIHQLVEVIGLDTAFPLCLRIAPRAGPVAVARLASALAEFEPTPRLGPALESEGVMVREALSRGQAFYPFGEEPGTDALTTPAIAFLPLRRYALLRQLQAQKEQAEIVALPWYESMSLLDRHEKAMAGTGLLADVARFGVANVRPFYRRMERLTVLRDLAFLALKAIEFRRIGLPAGKLDEFAPDAPVDRFSGQPYVYRALPDGFIVYSVGSNGEDDGGDAEKDIVLSVKL